MLIYNMLQLFGLYLLVNNIEIFFKIYYKKDNYRLSIICNKIDFSLQII